MAAEIEALRPQRTELAHRLPEAEKQAVATLARAQPEAAAELARTALKERANGRSTAPGTREKGGGGWGWGCRPRAAGPFFRGRLRCFQNRLLSAFR